MRAVAHAKVNLTLRVERLRPDGFHDLASVFQSIGWSDRLELSMVDPSAGEPGITSWDGGPVVDGEGNSAWRAVQAVRRHVGTEAGLALRLDKHIPVAAGLGGGSADAAAGLHLASRLLAAPPGPRCRARPRHRFRRAVLRHRRHRPGHRAGRGGDADPGRASAMPSPSWFPRWS